MLKPHPPLRDAFLPMGSWLAAGWTGLSLAKRLRRISRRSVKNPYSS